MTFEIPNFGLNFYLAAMPVLLLSFGAIVSMLQSVYPLVGGPKAIQGVLLVCLIGALGSVVYAYQDHPVDYLAGTLLKDSLAFLGQVSILLIGLAIALMIRDSHLKEKFFRGEISFLYMLSLAGMMIMVASDDMITMFIGLELSSISLYALVGYVVPSRRSQEGAIKYFILGAFSAGLLLFGFGLLFAGAGSMRFSEIVEILPKLADQNWIRLGALFTVMGLAFKMALAPFHLWAPDAYEAAPTGITALMATAVKIMIVIVMCRLFAGGYVHLYDVWTPALMFVAILSMVFGNILALVQSNIKRMLAYSSIAHSGYIAVAICAIGGDPGFSTAAVIFYIVGYAITSLGAFGILMWLETPKNDNLMLDDLNGLSKRHPWAAFSMTVFMFAFAGMPPTAGFIAKFFVFNAALKSELYSLVIVGAIGSTISLYYYLRVVVRMYMFESSKDETSFVLPKTARASVTMIAAALIATLLLGTLLPNKAMRIVKSSVSDLVQAH